MAFGCKSMNNVNICNHQITINKALQSFNLLIRIPESLIFKAVQTEVRQLGCQGHRVLPLRAPLTWCVTFGKALLSISAALVIKWG